MMIGMSSMAGGFIMVAVVLFGLWLWARILAKAGFSPWWALLALIPVVNPLAIWVFAFVEWPRGGNTMSSFPATPPAPQSDSASERLDSLDRRRAEGKVSGAEYAAKRREILDDL
jgi:hypothetical protein